MEKIKLLFIGCGNMGSRFARIASQMGDAEVAAVCDVTAERVEKLGTELKVKTYTDFRKMMDAHKDAKGAVITTPEQLHRESTVEALNRGLNVFVEKPVADTLEDASAILAAQKKSGKFLLVDHTLRFDARYLQARDAVARGDIGDVVNAYGRRDVPVALGNYAASRKTNLPMFLGVHEADILSWITGQKVKKVFAKEVTHKVMKDNHDCVVAILTLEKGAVAVCETAWQSPATQGRPQNLCLQVRGTEGTVDVSTYEQGLGIFNAKGAAHPDTSAMPSIYGRTLGMWPYAIMHFTDCIRLNKAPAMDPADAYHAVEVALAMMESLKTGREVSL